MKCEYCESDREGYDIAVFQPFDKEPNFEGFICDYCMDEIYYCEGCDRHIYENNGYRINVRYNDSVGILLCAKCLQEQWFVEGMDLFKDGDFFNNKDLLKHGFIKHSSWFCRSEESYKEVEHIFEFLQKQNYLVIVNIEASGMGLEHHLALWVKEKEGFYS